MRVALCQILVRAGDREGNFSRISTALASATEAGAELAVLPESAILGWIYPAAHQEAHAIPGPDTLRLCELARAYKIDVVVGIDEKAGDLLFDSAVAISRKGELLAVHRKFNVLPELMDPPYAVGEEVSATIVRFEWGAAAMLICADTFVDAAVDSIHGSGAQVLLVPYGWAAEPYEWPDHADKLSTLVRRRARRLALPVIGVDAVGEIVDGPWRGRTFGGASLAADPDGMRLTEPHLLKANMWVIDIAIPH